MTAAGSNPNPSKLRDARVLFVYDRHFSTFIERDWKIISAAFPDAELYCTGGMRRFFKLRAAVNRADLIFCWFAGRNALAATWWNRGRKPIVIVIGGYEVACEPEIGYGSFTRFPQGNVTRAIMHRADLLIAVSEYSAQAARVNAGADPSRLRVLYHGFDPDAWPMSTAPRDIDVTSVGSEEIFRKGIDLIAEAARLLPEQPFRIVGHVSEASVRRYVREIPGNLQFTGPLYGDELKQILARTRVYLQPSRHESFGCAVAEAMLMGCVPVVARASAQPEVVGDAGFYAEPLSGQGVADAVSRALAAAEENRQAARRRIAETFPLSAYAERLVSAIEGVLRDRGVYSGDA